MALGFPPHSSYQHGAIAAYRSVLAAPGQRMRFGALPPALPILQ